MKKSKTIKRKFSSSFKSKVAIDAARERQTTSELSQKYELHPTQINKWKKILLENASVLFETKLAASSDSDEELERLYCKIGKLEMEREYLKKSLGKLGWTEK